MITDRPYRAALGHKEAIAQLVKGSGTQFDPGIVRVFVECLSAEAEAAPTPTAVGHVRPR
jgi:HD-GYP domain-containing protein (c-di-GMP phosphodiesterase class II)